MILSDQMVVRAYSSHEAWRPGPLKVQAGATPPAPAPVPTAPPAAPPLTPQAQAQLQEGLASIVSICESIGGFARPRRFISPFIYLNREQDRSRLVATAGTAAVARAAGVPAHRAQCAVCRGMSDRERLGAGTRVGELRAGEGMYWLGCTHGRDADCRVRTEHAVTRGVPLNTSAVSRAVDTPCALHMDIGRIPSSHFHQDTSGYPSCLLSQRS